MARRAIRPPRQFALRRFAFFDQLACFFSTAWYSRHIRFATLYLSSPHPKLFVLPPMSDLLLSTSASHPSLAILRDERSAAVVAKLGDTEALFNAERVRAQPQPVKIENVEYEEVNSEPGKYLEDTAGP